MARLGYFVQNEKGYKSFKPSNLKDVEKRLNIDDEIKKLAKEKTADAVASCYDLPSCFWLCLCLLGLPVPKIL